MRRQLRTMARALLGGLLALMAVLLTGLSGGSLPTVDAQPALCPPTTGWSQIPGPRDPREEVVRSGRTVKNTALSIAVDGARPGQLYAGALWGAYMSDDCGLTWEQILGGRSPASPGFFGLAAATDPSGRAYLAGGVYNTLYGRDGDAAPWRGLKWRGHEFVGVASLGLSASPTGRLYVRTASAQGISNADRFMYTDDAGESWTVVSEPGPYSFIADPLTREVVYSYGVRRESPPYQMVRSMDSGATFHPWSETPERPGALAVSVDGSRFWLASGSQRLWQSRDGGGSWQHITDMPFTDPVQLVTSPHDPRVVFAVTKTALTEAGEIWAYREPAAAPTQVP